MVGEFFNAFAQHGNLHLGRAGVGGMDACFFDYFGLFLRSQHGPYGSTGSCFLQEGLYKVENPAASLPWLNRERKATGSPALTTDRLLEPYDESEGWIAPTPPPSPPPDPSWRRVRAHYFRVLSVQKGSQHPAPNHFVGHEDRGSDRGTGDGGCCQLIGPHPERESERPHVDVHKHVNDSQEGCPME